jgi:DNA-binding response OmpR family regulator
MIQLVSLILAHEGFSLVGALGGKEGLKTIRRLEPDLILLDLMMPDLSGWEVYQEIKSDEKLRHIPVVVITVRSDAIERFVGLHVHPVNGYLVKPFEIQELVRCVRKALNEHPSPKET